MTRRVLCFALLCFLAVGSNVEGGRFKRQRGWLSDLFGSGTTEEPEDEPQYEPGTTANYPGPPPLDEANYGVEDPNHATNDSNADGKQLIDNEDLEFQDDQASSGNNSTTSEERSSTTIPSQTPGRESSVSTPSTKTNTTIQHTTTANPECQKDNDMTTYCELSPDFTAYMMYNTTADSLAVKLFSPVVIDQLIRLCPPGNWCLNADYIQAFAQIKDTIFQGPLCTDGLIECVDLMVFKRQGCTDMVWLSTFNDALTLICEMNGLSDMTQDCFAHTIASLHVTLADKIRGAAQNRNYGEEFCLGEYVGMTKRFMCALDKCPEHQHLFEEYEPWQWFMTDAPVIKEECHLESVCGDEEALVEGTTTSTTPAPYDKGVALTSTEANLPNQRVSELPTERPQETTGARPEQPEQVKPIFIIQASDENTRFLIGVITAALVAFLGIIVLVCAVRRHMRRTPRLLSKDGYSKLPTDDRP